MTISLTPLPRLFSLEDSRNFSAEAEQSHHYLICHT